MVGGSELRQPIFVSEVVPNSIPAQEGLKVGDQVSIGNPFDRFYWSYSFDTDTINQRHQM